MSKFDLVFEKAMYSLNEREFVDSTFEDNVRELAKAIKTFLPQKSTEEKTIDSAVNQVINHDGGVKEMFLGSQMTKQIKLHLTQPGDSGSLEVILIGKDVPEGPDKLRRKVISNDQHEENVFKAVSDELVRLTMGSPADALEEMPQEQGANAQPGAEESALPKV